MQNEEISFDSLTNALPFQFVQRAFSYVAQNQMPW